MYLFKYHFIIICFITVDLSAQGGITTLSQRVYAGLISFFQPEPQHQCYMYRPNEFPDAIRKMTPAECQQHAYEMRSYVHEFAAALKLAVRSGSTEYTKALLESCADKLPKNGFLLPLIEASNKNRFDLFKMIIESGAVSEKLVHSELPRALVKAALSDFMDFAIHTEKWLRRLNFSINNPADALDSVIWDLENEVTIKAYEHGAKKRHSLPLHAAVDMNRKNMALYLLQCGSDPLQEDHEKVTALTIITRRAAVNPEFCHLQLLLHLYINYRKKVTDTGSHQLGHPIIFTLCPGLVSVHNKDSRGNTLVHAAVEDGDWQLAQKLLEIEPLLFAEKNNAGYTPLMLAVAHKHEMLNKLIAYAYSQNKKEAVINQVVPA